MPRIASASMKLSSVLPLKPCQVDQSADVGDVGLGDEVAAVGRDRHRDLLQRLLALLRGDDDFLELGCGQRRRRHGDRKRGDDQPGR